VKKILFLFLLLTACTESPKPPPGTLDKDRMINILIDIHIAEAKAGGASLRSQDSATVYYKVLEGDVFKKHGVDSTTYYNSYRYYMRNIKEMDQIYAAVVDSLSLRENSIK
jgi:hypothetical protein